MKAFIKYSSGDESIVENFQYLLMSSNSGNTKVSKEDVSSKVFSSGKRYTFVGDRTVSTVSLEFLISNSSTNFFKQLCNCSQQFRVVSCF